MSCDGEKSTVNSQMHPRNIYRVPLNFKELAISFPNLRPYIKISLSGQASYNFRFPKAIAELTRALLLRDFELNVDIPVDRLVPTVPLRLNYILWIEDILTGLGPTEDGRINGIDVGTGSSCIYALLAAKKGWQILATEQNKESAELAKNNVEKNNLSHLIHVKNVDEKSCLFIGAIDDDKSYHFSMCNPPFYSECDVPKNRSSHRPLPKHPHTGITDELITMGGEVKFIHRMFEESCQLRDKIKVYTTMIGKKHDFNILLRELKKLPKLQSYISTEFHQGSVTRWAIAWSFSVSLTNPQKCTRKERRSKDASRLTFIIPPEIEISMAKERIMDLLKELQLTFDVESACPLTFNATAFQNTWSKQRRKRREQDRKATKPDDDLITVPENAESRTQLEGEPSNDFSSIASTSQNGYHNLSCEINANKRKQEEIVRNDCKRFKSERTNDGALVTNGHSLIKDINEIIEDEKPGNEIIEDEKPEDDVSSLTKVPILEFLLKLLEHDGNLSLEFTLLSGSAGKIGLNEISQFFRNKMVP